MKETIIHAVEVVGYAALAAADRRSPPFRGSAPATLHRSRWSESFGMVMHVSWPPTVGAAAVCGQSRKALRDMIWSRHTGLASRQVIQGCQ